MNADARTLVLSLPTPSPIVVRVSHEPREKGGSYFYAITSQGLELINSDSSNRTQAINKALTNAQMKIERVCKTADVVVTAKRNTEEILAPTFQAVGWKVIFFLAAVIGTDPRLHEKLPFSRTSRLLIITLGVNVRSGRRPEIRGWLANGRSTPR